MKTVYAHDAKNIQNKLEYNRIIFAYNFMNHM